jgi:uncharacterized membrane protein
MTATTTTEREVEIRPHHRAQLVLCYSGVLALVPLLTVRDSEFVRWHARQGLALGLAQLAYFISALLFGLIPVVGWVPALALWLVSPGWVLLAVVAMVRARQKDRWEIPWASSLARRL